MGNFGDKQDEGCRRLLLPTQLERLILVKIYFKSENIYQCLENISKVWKIWFKVLMNVYTVWKIYSKSDKYIISIKINLKSQKYI